MTKPTDPYSRFYWSLVDDEKFVEVYPDDNHMALYARLLIAADMAWPASAPLPYRMRRASLRKLADVGIIDLLPGDRYRVHGLDAERGKRQQKGRNAAASRWDDDEHPPSIANGVPEHPSSIATAGTSVMPRAGAEPSRAKPSQVEPSRVKGLTTPPGSRKRARLDDAGSPE